MYFFLLVNLSPIFYNHRPFPNNPKMSFQDFQRILTGVCKGFTDALQQLYSIIRTTLAPLTWPSSTSTKVVPRSVNFHFTRKCNYTCGFCFHTATNSFILPLEEAKRGLKLLVENGKVTAINHTLCQVITSIKCLKCRCFALLVSINDYK